MRVMWIFRLIHSFYMSISMEKILKGSLQPKLKAASVWPFNARCRKCLQAEAVIHDHCTGTVKKK